MSEKSTRLTQELLTKDFSEIFDVTSDEAWVKWKEIREKSINLSSLGLIDDGAIREISLYNAGKHNLDVQAADNVLDIRQKPSGGSLVEMHAPSRSVWQGTGTFIAAAGPDVVHYVNKPGLVESNEFGGPGFPYIMSELCVMSIAHNLKGYRLLDNRGGYQYVTNRKHRLGEKGLPHIGAIAVTREDAFRPRSGTPDALVVSASGTMVNDWVDETYQRIDKYAERAIEDEANGLFDGHPEYRRLGLYDVAAAEMAALTLYGDMLEDCMLQVFNPDIFEGVDIN